MGAEVTEVEDGMMYRRQTLHGAEIDSAAIIALPWPSLSRRSCRGRVDDPRRGVGGHLLSGFFSLLDQVAVR